MVDPAAAMRPAGCQVPQNAPCAGSRPGVLSAGSQLSVLSAGSILSVGSSGSILSVGSTGSILSVGSAGSILSVGSAASILSVGSFASVLSFRSAFSIMGRHDTFTRGRKQRKDWQPRNGKVVRLVTLAALGCGLSAALCLRSATRGRMRH